MKFECGENCRPGSAEEQLLMLSNDLLQVVREWVKTPGHRVCLGTAYDDFDEHNLISVEFSSPESEGAVYFIPRNIAEKNWPGIKSLDNFVEESEEEWGPTLDVQEKELEKHLGFSFDRFFEFDLQGPLLPFEHAVHYAAMYAMSDLGEASFSPLILEYDFEEFENKKLFEQSVLSVHLNHRAKQPKDGIQPGFGETVYCLQPE